MKRERFVTLAKSAIALPFTVLAVAGAPEALASGCTANNPNPPSIQAGSAATSVTISVSGFGSATSALLQASSPPTPVTLPVTSLGPTQDQVTIPATYLAVPQTLTILLFSGVCGSLPLSVTVQVTSAVPLAAVGLPNSANPYIPVTVLIGARGATPALFSSSVSRLSEGNQGWTSCGSCHTTGGVSDGPKWIRPFEPHEVAAPGQRVLNWTSIFDEVQEFERNVPGTGRRGGTTAVQVQHFIPDAFTQPGGSLQDLHAFNIEVDVNPNTGGQTTIIPLFREYRPGSYPLSLNAICNSQASAPGTVANGCFLNIEKILARSTSGAMRIDPDGQQITYSCSSPTLCTSVTPGDVSTIAFAPDGSAVVKYANQIQEQYNPSGRLVGILDPRGPEVSVILDALGRANKVTDNFGNNFNVTRGSGENTFTDQAGRSVALSLDSSGNLDEFTDPLDNTYQFTHGPIAGSFAAVTDPNGDITSFAFDSQSQVNQITSAVGGIKGFTYSLSSTNVVDEGGNPFIYEYDTRRRTTSLSNGVNATYSFAYGANGVLDAVTDPLGFVRAWQTDVTLNVVKYTDQENNSTLYSYDARNNRTGVTDALGNTARAMYDSNNQPTSVTDFRGNSVKTTYDAIGRPTSKTFANKVIDEIVYDDQSQTVTENFAAGTSTSYVVQTTFDAEGRWVTRTTPNRQDTAAWNGNNQLVQLILGAGQSDAVTTRHYYDSRGNEIQVTDTRGINTNFIYNALNEPIQIIRAAGLSDQSVIAFGYNLAGDLTTRTNPLGGVTFFTLNADHQPVGVQDSLGHTSLVQYDLNARPTQTTDPAGNIITYTYDARGSVVKKSLSDGTAVVYTYDALDRRVSMADKTGTTTTAYDGNDRVIQRIDGNGDSVMHAFDNVGNLTVLTHSDGSEVKKQYNPLGLVVAVTAPMLGKTKISYDAGLNPSQIKYTHGVTDQRTFNPFHYLIRDVVTRGSHTVFSASYTYDAAGNGVSSTTGSDLVTRTFDGFSRVVQENLNGTTNLVSYDPNSDMLSDGSNAASYDSEGGLIGFNLTTVSNDANNNLISGLGQTLTYTSDRVLHTFAGATGTALYISNGDRWLTDETTSKGTYHSVYDGSKVIELSGPDGPIHFVRLGSAVLATTNASASQIFIPVYDPSGSPVVVIDGAGNVVQNHYNFLGAQLNSDSLGLKFPVGAFGCMKDPSGDLRCTAKASLYNTATGRTNDQATTAGLWPPNHRYMSFDLEVCLTRFTGGSGEVRGTGTITSQPDFPWLDDIGSAGTKLCGGTPLPPGHDFDSFAIPGW